MSKLSYSFLTPLVLGFKLRAMDVLSTCWAAQLWFFPLAFLFAFYFIFSENLKTFGVLIKPCFLVT